MRALSLLATCIVFAALANAQAAPAPYRLLSAEEILASVSDATASELRFVLRAGSFADGGVGFDGATPRAATAFQRLVRTKDAATLELLCRCDDDVSAMYGLKGLAEVDPAKLAPLLPKFARRRERVYEASGCCGGDTSLAAEAMELARRDTVSAIYKQACVTAWLEALHEQGARLSDHSCAWACVHMMNAPFADRGSRFAAVCRYAEAQTKNDEELLQRVAQSQSEQVDFRLLCTDFLAWKNARDDWTPAGVDRMAAEWATVQSLTSTEEWLIIVSARAWQLWAPINTSMKEAGRPDDFRSAWQDLTLEQWRPLTEHKNVLVREAAKFLKRHPVTGLTFIKDPPTGDNARRLWLRTKLARAKSAADFRPILAHLAAHADDYPFGRLRRGEFRYYVDESCADAPLECAPELAAWALALANSPKLALRLISFKLLRLWEGHELGREVIRHPAYNQLLKFLKQDVDQADAAFRWEARDTAVYLLYASQRLTGDNERLALQWANELARELVTKPRQMLVCKALSERLSGRAPVLLRAIAEGACFFIPDNEWSAASQLETFSPEELLTRMKTALAKLD